jgi:cytochrome c oxidase subunit 5b
MQALSRTIAKAPLRALTARTLAVRSLSTSPRTFSEAAPSLFGEGSKAGQISTDIEQATGLERLQLLGQLQSIDVFNTGPLHITKLGTVEDPTLVPAYVRNGY